jgi:GntR family transcriptional regulator, transcriptional repressor for pyruvate dehydrogenase complex
VNPRSEGKGDKRGSPELLADALMARIFRGEIAAGSRLPPERQLAIDLDVDRTTLRMALKQLQRMNLLVARHGSGIEVNDYRADGGLDVLAALFAIDGVPLDASLVFEALDFWEEAFSITAAKAIARMTVDELRGLELMLDRSLDAIGDVEAFLDAQLAIQDRLARLSGNVMFRMLSNSTRPVRRRIMRLLPETADMEASLSEMKQMLRVAVATRPGEAAIREGLLAALRRQSAGLRSRLLLPPANPAARKASKTNGQKTQNETRSKTQDERHDKTQDERQNKTHASKRHDTRSAPRTRRAKADRSRARRRVR